MPDSGEFITVREAFNTFTTKGDMVQFMESFKEHREDDRAAFQKVDEKLNLTNNKMDELRDEVRSGKLPRWAYWVIGTTISLLVPFMVVGLEWALKVRMASP